MLFQEKWIPAKNHQVTVSSSRDTTHDSCRENKIKNIFSEKPSTGSDLEWWFCHGYFQSQWTEPVFFMTSFFRAMSNEGSEEKSGHAFISTVIGMHDSSHRFVTCVDQGAQVLLFQNLRNLQSTSISDHLLRSYMDEVQEYGPPHPIVLKESTPRVSNHELNILWDSYCLYQEGEAFRLLFVSEDGRSCDFYLRPQYERLDVTSVDHHHFKGMAYYTYPRITLGGTVDGEPVSGEAWLDHQYGDSSWFFQQRDQERMEPLSWIWAGLNCDDGTDILFLQQMDATASAPVYKVMHWRDPKGCVHKETNVHVHIVRTWESPWTHIRYPLEFRLEVPDMDISLSLQPIADDQEIPFLGIQRAIWEGAGMFSGTWQGHAVSGRCRIELNGFGYVVDSQEYIQSFIQKIDAHLASLIPPKIDAQWVNDHIGKECWRHDPLGITEVLAKPCWNFLSRPGKHWRPLCAMLFVESTGVVSEPYARMISLFTELNHTGSLIIDDIEDDSLMRRGEQCLHLQYGLDVAINLGNSLYFLPYSILKDYPYLTETQRLEIYKLIIQVGTRAHIGQGLDIYWSKNLSEENLTQWMQDSFDEKLLQMYAFKTGAGVEAVGELACILCMGSDEQRQVYASLGRIFGVAFQIIDDVQNFNQSPGWTKTCGEDIISGKPTYVIVSALRRLLPEKQKRFMEIFCSPHLRRTEPYLQEAVQLIRESGALQACRRKAEEMIETEWKQFNAYAFHCDAKIMLRMVISALLNYSYDY